MSDKGHDDLDALVASPRDGKPRDGKARAGSAPRSATTTTGGNRREASPMPLGVVIALAVIAIGGGALGYVLHQQLQLAQAQLVAADGRIQRLETELNMTGSVITESDQKTKEQLSFWESETRKLWEKLRSNESKISDGAKANASLEGALRVLRQNTDRMDAAIAQQAKVVEGNTQWMNQYDNTMKQVLNQSRDLTDKINAADQSARALRVALEKRMQEQERSQAAMESFRREINRTVTALQQQVNAATAPAGGVN